MRYVFRTPFVHIPTSAYVYVRRRLENSLMTLGLALLWVGAAKIFFAILGFSGSITGLMLPLTVQVLLMSESVSAFMLTSPVVVLFSSLAFAPVVEEFLFRDLVITLTKGLSDSKRQVVILAISGVVFGMAHGHPFKIMLQGVLGVLLALLYLRSGPNRLASYGSCVFVHACYNFLITAYSAG